MTWVGDAVIVIDVTVYTFPSGSTITFITIYEVLACAAVLANSWCTVVDVFIALLTFPASLANAAVPVNSVNTCAMNTWVGVHRTVIRINVT